MGTPRRSHDKKLKDPSAPKRPLSAFMLFSQEERPRVLADLGNLSLGEVGSELGKRWTSLDAEAKGKYDEKSMKEKERYAEELKEYTPSKEFLEAKSEQEARAAVTADAEAANVDSPLLAYFTFLLGAWKPLSEALPGLSPMEIQQSVHKAWLHATGAPLPEETSKALKVKKAKDPNEPKRPKNAFLLYADKVRGDILENNPTLAHKEVLKIVAEKWQALSENDKKPFVEAYSELQDKYKQNIEAFKESLKDCL